jgi:antitoxin ParD1/3/4
VSIADGETRANRNSLERPLPLASSIADGETRANRNIDPSRLWRTVSIADGETRANRNSLERPLPLASSIADGETRANRANTLRPPHLAILANPATSPRDHPMPARNINLTQEQDAFIQSVLDSGEYRNASEAVRDALRALQQRRREDAFKLRALRQQIKAGAEALRRGDFIGVDDRDLNYLEDLTDPAP